MDKDGKWPICLLPISNEENAIILVNEDVIFNPLLGGKGPLPPLQKFRFPISDTIQCISIDWIDISEYVGKNLRLIIYNSFLVHSYYSIDFS